MTNLETRCLIADSGLKQYQIAAEIGCSEFHFSRMLRSELSPEKKQQIREAINKLQLEKLDREQE